jgi:hypothetical protein
MRPIAFLLLFFFTAACGRSPEHPQNLAPSKPVVTFPTKAEIAGVPSRPPPRDAFGSDTVGVREWTVVFPPAESLAGSSWASRR